MNIYQILSKIQRELVCPKNRKNNFNNFMYRSCEDILEAVKKILPSNCAITLTDEIFNSNASDQKRGETGELAYVSRVYVKATATLFLDDGSSISASAYAREPLEKKKFDESQLTGTASSYARKYALNGLFMIDDEEDADAHHHAPEKDKNISLVEKRATQVLQENVDMTDKITQGTLNVLYKIIDEIGDEEVQIDKWLNHYGVNKLSDLKEYQAQTMLLKISARFPQVTNIK